MTTETEPTITRAQLQEVCERIIRDTPRLGPEDRAKLHFVARVAPVIAGDSTWWDPETECGCLVGTLLHHQPLPRTPLHCAGVIYLRALRQIVSYDGARGHVLPVIDP